MDFAFSNYHIIFFNQSRYCYSWVPHKRFIIDFFVKRFLSIKMKYAWQFPFDVIGETRQDLTMV